jgi:hypothetical protein
LSATYDALNRKTSEKTADNSKRWWCYNGVGTSGQPNCSQNLSRVTGTWVDITDENGNHSQEVTDARGRLMAVLEPDPNTNTLALETDYSYDPLGNLTLVVQHGTSAETPRSRNFTYDSLSRLTSATNPETGAVSYGYLTSGNTPCAGDVSLPCTKTNARNITTSYSFDALNRLTGKTYSGQGTSAAAIAASTSSSCFQYDTSSFATTPGNFVGRLTSEWTQSGSCPVTVPPAGYKTRRSILAYDSIGRITVEQQCNLGTCTTGLPYTTTSSYDLAGNQLTYTNGLQSLSFTKIYDAAGRLQTATKDAFNSTPQDLLLTIGNYTPSGAVLNMSLGSGISVTKTYDNRLRPMSETAVHQ